MAKKMTIGKQLWGGFSIILILLVIMGVMSYLGLSKINDETTDMVGKNELVQTLARREIDHLNWANKVSELFIDDTVTELTVQTDDHKCAFGKWLYGPGREEAEKQVPQLATILKEIEGCHLELHTSAIEIKDCFDPANTEQASNVYLHKTCPSLKQVQALLGQATEHVEAAVETVNADTLHTSKTTQAEIGIITLLTIVIGVFCAFFIARRIVKVLRRIIESLQEGAEQVASASGQVSSASQSLAEGATEQAAGLEETSSSLEEMSAMTKQNADNAQQANTLSSDAQQSAQEGSEAMLRMSQAIDDIQKSSDETAKIIKVIDEIAFQTNLLALNAAVEAARAGEAGKGFAVVAEEVRNLAMRSADAAKNTADMIEESVKNAKNGVTISAEVSKTLEEIVNGVQKTSDLVGEISAASDEQAQGIDQVNTAVNQMDKVTQQNAANAEESASASEELSAQAEQMLMAVQDLAGLVQNDVHATLGSSKTGSRGIFKSRLKVSDEAFHQISDSGKNCWDVKQCGRIPGGDKVDELGVCPAYPNGGKICWRIAGTFCGGNVQGSAAKKLSSCTKCEFYKEMNSSKLEQTVSAQTAIPFDDDFSDF